MGEQVTERIILLLDDCRTTRRVVGGMLTELGFSVREAATGSAGLAQLLLAPLPEGALVDWNMPEMDGLEFVRRLRAEPRYAGIRVLMATTRRQLEEVREALEAGADEFIMKPFTREMLVDKLSMIGLTDPEESLDASPGGAGVA